MALDNVSPKIVAARLINRARDLSVWTQAATDVSGDVVQSRGGSYAFIELTGTLTIQDYVEGTALTGPQYPDDKENVLELDKRKAFNLAVDWTKSATSPIDDLIGGWVENGAVALAKQMNTDIRAAAITGAGTAIAIDTDGASAEGQTALFNAIKGLVTVFDDAEVPQDRRVAVLSSFARSVVVDKILGDDKGSGQFADNILSDAELSQIFGFRLLTDIYNNSSATSGSVHAVALDPLSLFYAVALSNAVSYIPENAFADAVKGLTIYGAKAVDSNIRQITEAS